MPTDRSSGGVRGIRYARVHQRRGCALHRTTGSQIRRACSWAPPRKRNEQPIRDDANDTPTFIDVPIETTALARHRSLPEPLAARTAPRAATCMFVLSSLGSRRVGAQDRAHGEPPQGRRRARDARLSQRTRTRSSRRLRRDVPLHEARARAASSRSLRCGGCVACMITRAARDGDRGESLPGAVRGSARRSLLPHRPRTVALVNTSTFRGRRLSEAPLSDGAGAFRSDRAWLAGAAPLLGRCQPARHSTIPPSSTTASTRRTSSHVVASKPAKRLRASLGVEPAGVAASAPSGGCAPEKNQEVLLTTLRHLRVARVDAHLVIAGGGPLRDHLLRARGGARRSPIACISSASSTTCGRCSPRSTCSCCPRSAVESFSNAALEAMAMGRPVILSDIGGAREMIDDGVEGYVVSPTELAARLPAFDRGAVC